MRRALQRARALVFGLALLAAFVPAGRAEAAGACGYVKVLTNTIPLLTLCTPADCDGVFPPPVPIGPTETFVCVRV